MLKISEAKSKFISLFLEDEELLKCLCNRPKDFLNHKLPGDERILYKHIYPFPFVPNVDEVSNTFLTMDFQYIPSKKSSTYYRTGFITFHVFCPTDLVETDYEALRYDYAIEHIDGIVRGARSQEWLGKMEFYEAKDQIFDPRGKYVGINATYKNYEFC